MKKILQIFSVLLLSCLAVVLFGVAMPQKANADSITDMAFCRWKTQSLLRCVKLSDNAIAQQFQEKFSSLGIAVGGAQQAIGSDSTLDRKISDLEVALDIQGNCSGVVSASCDDLYYDTDKSTPQKAVFRSKVDSGYFEKTNTIICTTYTIPAASSPTGNDYTSAGNACNKSDNNAVTPGDQILVGDLANATVESGDACGIVKNWLKTGCTSALTNQAQARSADVPSPFLDAVTATQKIISSQKNNGGACIDSPLSFFLCPIRDFLVSTFGTAIDSMVALLANPKISSDAGLGKALGGFITIANSFYVLIFLFIILANFIAIPGLDNYTIKKLLPKLIAAIILTQFAFIICGAVLDIANIAAVTLPRYILESFGIANKTPGQAFVDAVAPLKCVGSTAGCSALDIGKDLGKFMLLQITLIVGIIVALISLIYIVFRYLFLAILIIFSPLAFAAWVLPNTEKYFKEWWKYYIKLSIMFLLVNLLLVFGAIFSKLFDPANGGIGGSISDTFIYTLIDIIIPLIILFLIPKTLKVSGDIMTSAGKLVGGAVAGSTAGKAGISAVKKSNQEGKLAEIRGGAQEKFGKKIGNVGMEARGKALSRQRVNKEKEAVSQLGLSRQVQLANSGNSTAQSTINSKLSDLSNKRVLTGQEYHDLYRLQRNAIAPEVNGETPTNLTPQQQADLAAVDRQFADLSQLQYDPDDNNKVVSYNSLSNPLYNGSTSSAGGGGQPGTPPAAAGGGTQAPAAAPGGTGTSGTATPGTGAGPGQARSSAAQALRGARAGRAATGSTAAPLSNPNAAPPPNPAGGPPGGGTPPTPPPAGGPPGFPGP